jgi:segregation and condensation protein B
MDYFGINSTDDLPKIREVLAEQSIQGTLISDAVNAHGGSDPKIESVPGEELLTQPQEATNTTLIVADTGELIEKPLQQETELSAENNIAEEDNSAKEEEPAENKSEDDKQGESSEDIKRED